MKANCITVSIPASCTKNCPYCISNITFPVKDNEKWFNNNLQKAVKLAERLSVSHCLVTSKGEPLNNIKTLRKVLFAFSDFPIEIQTHYCSPCFREDIVTVFHDVALNVLAISVDNPEDLDSYHIWKKITSYPWAIRMAVVLTDSFKQWRLQDFIDFCKKYKIEQLTIRNPTIPNNHQQIEKSIKTVNWIKQNISNNLYINITKELMILREKGRANFIRDLQFGASVYDIDGIGFVHMNYCVEEQNGDTIRSLIYQSDGHLYTTWDYPGSLIF